MPASLRPLLDSAPDAMLVVDRSGVILSINQYAFDLFGYAPAELDGQLVELLVPERFRLQHIGHRLHFTDDLRKRPMGAGIKLLARCKDGSERAVEIGLRSVQRGLQTFIVVEVRDMSRYAQA